jgi:hypothetical protein
MNEKAKRKRLMISIPDHLKEWLHRMADANCSTANAEVVRSVLERRERLEAAQRAVP